MDLRKSHEMSEKTDSHSGRGDQSLKDVGTPKSNGVIELKPVTDSTAAWHGWRTCCCRVFFAGQLGCLETIFSSPQPHFEPSQEGNHRHSDLSLPQDRKPRS